MSKTTAPAPTTENKTAPAIDAALADKAKAQADIRAKATTEATDFQKAVDAIMANGEALGNLALDSLAEALGKSANKLGRPTESAYLAFSLATAARKMTIERRSDLAKKANSQVPEGHKPVATLKAKANHNSGSASYRFNLPVAVAVNLGE